MNYLNSDIIIPDEDLVGVDPMESNSLPAFDSHEDLLGCLDLLERVSI